MGGVGLANALAQDSWPSVPSENDFRFCCVNWDFCVQVTLYGLRGYSHFSIRMKDETKIESEEGRMEGNSGFRSDMKLRIIFFTQEDPFYVKVFFEEFLKTSGKLDEIEGIVISKPLGRRSKVRLGLEMYGLYGLVDFLRMGIRYAYAKSMGALLVRSSGVGNKGKGYTISQLGRGYGLNVIERSDLNSSEFIKMIGGYGPDLFISVASPMIFGEKLLAVPRLGCINIHSAPLPWYRGMLPNFWQLYHGEKEAGITVHRMDRGIDTGDVIIQKYVPIESGDSLSDVIRKSKRLGARMMIEVIEQFRHGRVTYRTLGGKGSYFSFPTRRDVMEFRRRGFRML